MPDFVTHHLFGDTLEQPQLLEHNHGLFCWGLQGPDLLFYRKVIAGAPYHALGGRMHDQHIVRLFETMASYCRGLTGEAQEMTAAYISGFAAHYSLDSAVHPYVYAQQHRLEPLHPERSPSAIHGSIESDMDMDLYGKVRHCPVTTFRPADSYTLTPLQQKALGALYTHLLYNVYGTLLSPSEVIAAQQDTLAVQKLLFSGSRALRTAAELLDNTKGKGSGYFSSHLKGRQPQWDSLNLNHTTWVDPWTGENRSESIPELMELAGERYSRLVDVLGRNIGGASLVIPAEWDFSGRAL